MRRLSLPKIRQIEVMKTSSSIFKLRQIGNETDRKSSISVSPTSSIRKSITKKASMLQINDTGPTFKQQK